MNNFEPIVRFLSQWISKQVQLIKERKVRQEVEELVQITKLVFSDQKSGQKLELL
jgi:hypothetical protein